MFELELRVYGNSLGESLRVTFKNYLALTIHRQEIFEKALHLGGQIANESLIMFTTTHNLMELVKFIASL